ncbi:hypothetical protein WS67_22875 [Burkholderia singularis]|uniref:DUF2486 domain-containing protein n=1 Tax=Burkholderia singularis TaxID=1503053 RepID=A0A118DLM3_9BURK|nr:hypothetical protein AQ611_13945 [Burkholderia sp. Bp7605]KVE23524.1 hypothetical protein WS67_22875 [Burkholderia singularis]SMF98178.1 FIG00452715: hypothetical protein [Burkholderia singularis]
MSEANEIDPAGEAPIPVLSDVLVPGNPALARPPAAGASRQPPAASADARRIAERLQDRLHAYLAGDGRELVEARCRDALQVHTARLVGQIAGEVSRVLETEIAAWVAQEIDAALAHHRQADSGGGSQGSK